MGEAKSVGLEEAYWYREGRSNGMSYSSSGMVIDGMDFQYHGDNLTHDKIHGPLSVSLSDPLMDGSVNVGSDSMLPTLAACLSSENGSGSYHSRSFTFELGADCNRVVNKIEVHPASLQVLDIKGLIDVAEFSESPCLQLLNSPFCYTTPTNLANNISVTGSSPESMLRKSAMSFNNTPSIIRKPKSRKGGNSKNSDSTCAWKRDSIGEKNMKQGFLSSPGERDISFSGLSVERCFEHAFDMEGDLATGKCGNWVSSYALSEPNLVI